MGRRFQYKLMNAMELSAQLEELDVQPGTFARIFGVEANKVNRMIFDGDPIPPWVTQGLAFLRMPGGIVEAKLIAADMIVRDNRRPDMGEYPYRVVRGDHDNS